jgi:hypothetical protein
VLRGGAGHPGAQPSVDPVDRAEPGVRRGRRPKPQRGPHPRAQQQHRARRRPLLRPLIRLRLGHPRRQGRRRRQGIEQDVAPAPVEE